MLTTPYTRMLLKDCFFTSLEGRCIQAAGTTTGEYTCKEQGIGAHTSVFECQHTREPRQLVIYYCPSDFLSVDDDSADSLFLRHSSGPRPFVR